jgi:hypothetical protein
MIRIVGCDVVGDVVRHRVYLIERRMLLASPSLPQLRVEAFIGCSVKSSSEMQKAHLVSNERS